MKIKLYLIGVLVSFAVLFAIFINTTTGSVATLHASALAFSYLVYSTLAIVLSSFGKTKSSKAAWFFFLGIAVLFAFLPSLRYLVSWFYIPLHGHWGDFRETEALRDLYFYAPMIVSALFIYRGISLWSENSIGAKEGPNQTQSQPIGGSS